MALITPHKILVKARDLEAAQRQISTFFTKTMLLNYDKINFDSDISCQATDNGFWEMTEKALKENRQVLDGFIKELEDTGFHEIRDLAQIPFGYQSKVLHILAHFLDGFIGIDSVFYNLTDDSHWVSDSLRQQITTSPADYWLVQVNGTSDDLNKAAVVHI